MPLNGRSLPLGIDIGRTGIRVVRAVRRRDGLAITGVAVREIDNERSSVSNDFDSDCAAQLIDEMLEELGTKERRCITSIGLPDAHIRNIRCPRMTALERERWARYEVERNPPFPVKELLIRMYPAGQEYWSMGVARSAAIQARLAALRKAKLRTVCVDHESFALLRALPDFDAVLDVGYKRTSLHIRGEHGPETAVALCGSADVTVGIARDLCVDETTAEKRKRIVGTAGAGEHARARLCSEISTMIRRTAARTPFSRLAVVGNGARLSSLCEEIAFGAGVDVRLSVNGALANLDGPSEALRSGALNWTLATGLALWYRA